jgi:hypothetical protein
MVVRPLAAYRSKPIRRTIVRKTFDHDMVTELADGDVLMLSTNRRPLKVLKLVAARQEDPLPDTHS